MALCDFLSSILGWRRLLTHHRRYRTDAHYVKALRSMHEASKTWGDPNQYYLKAAVKMADDFDGWGGFEGQ